MKYYFLSTFFLLGLSFGTLKAEDTTKKVESLKIEVKGLKKQQERLYKELNALSLKNAKTEVQMSELQTVNKKLISGIDSLRNEHSIVVANQKQISRSLSIVSARRTKWLRRQRMCFRHAHCGACVACSYYLRQ